MFDLARNQEESWALLLKRKGRRGMTQLRRSFRNRFSKGS